MLEDETQPVAPGAVREELQRILASRVFATAARSQRFLSYIIEQTLAGHQDAIKELVLGIEVFDRSNSFDPRTDTIVRVEAGKLRKRLEEYYGSEGMDSAVRIDVPKGSYVPQFRMQADGKRLGWKYAAGLMAVALIAAGAYWGIRVVRGRAPVSMPSIAVLPFQNFSADAANEYIADGLAEDLTDALVRGGGIRVASRTSAFFFKGRQADVQEIGKRLRVAFLVEGSIRKAGPRLKITAQLVRTGDGYHVWSRSFERDMNDLFAVQQEIAQAVATTLEQKLTGSATRRPTVAHAANAQAFDLYLKGRHSAATGAPTTIDAAENLFRQSIAADPAYARPYLALAELYIGAEIMDLRPTGELIAKAKEAAKQALALDAESAEAHAVLASLTARYEFDWATAERQAREALELDPNSAPAHNDLAQNILAPQGRWEEAMAENKRAIELDPFSPSIAVGQPWLLYLQRRSKPAIEGFRKLAPDPAALVGLASALAQDGDYRAAIDALDQVQKIGPSPATLAYLGYYEARAGRTAEAQKVLLDLTAQAQTRYISPGYLAVAYVGLQDRNRAFQCLESPREHPAGLLFIRVDSIFDPIRTDPRYARLLAELRLTDREIQERQSLSRAVHR